MTRSETLRSYFGASAFDSGEIWQESAGGGWASAIVTLLLVAWQLLRFFYSRRIQRASWAQGSFEDSALIASSGGGSSSGFALHLQFCLFVCFDVDFSAQKVIFPPSQLCKLGVDHVAGYLKSYPMLI